MANGPVDPTLATIQSARPEDIQRAVLARLRLGSQAGAQQLAQNIRTTGGGLRTSGVSLIPLREQMRSRQAAETQAVIGLGGQQIQQQFQAEQAALNRAFASEQGRIQREEAASRAARLGRQGLQRALLGGGIGLIGTLGSAALAPAAATTV